MTVAAFLTSLYPPAVRDRWGADLRGEIAASGIRSWPDTITQLVHLWLHPGDWPESFAGQTRRVVTVAIFVIAAAAGLLLRTVAPSPALTASLHHPATSLWVIPLAAAVLLAMPVPQPGRDSFRRLLTETALTLALPGVAGAAVVAIAWSGAADAVAGPADAALTAFYWLTLGFIAFRLCVCIARVMRCVESPSRRRISRAQWLLAAGLGSAAVQSSVGLMRAAPHPAAVAQTVTLAVLAALTISIGHDLRTKERHRAPA
jgi:hypothetical protein